MGKTGMSEVEEINEVEEIDLEKGGEISTIKKRGRQD